MAQVPLNPLHNPIIHRLFLPADGVLSPGLPAGHPRGEGDGPGLGLQVGASTVGWSDFKKKTWTRGRWTSIGTSGSSLTSRVE